MFFFPTSLLLYSVQGPSPKDNPLRLLPGDMLQKV